MILSRTHWLNEELCESQQWHLGIKESQSHQAAPNTRLLDLHNSYGDIFHLCKCAIHLNPLASMQIA